MTKRTIIAIIILLAILGLVLIWQNRRDKTTVSDLILSVAAENRTKNANAAEVPANPGDVIVYTLTVENPGDKVVSGYVIETNITDIGELADLTDASGANYNPTNGTLVWTPLDVPAKESITAKFTAQVKNDIPAGSDMVMKVKFNNELAVSVSRSQVAGDVVPPPPAPTSAGNGQPGEFRSPQTGLSGTLNFAMAAGVTLGVFALRRRRSLSWG